MMSSRITDVIISPFDTTATIFRITNVSRTMTIAQSSDCVNTAYLIHFNPLMIYTDADLTKNHARISNGAQKTYTMRIERAIPQRTIKSI
jgi:hypothetical protein